MRDTLLLWLAAGLFAALHAQTRPVRIAGQCTIEAVQNQSLPCSSEQPCPLYLELAGAEQVSGRTILTGNIHTAAATIESVLLTSEDGGRTWTEAHTRIPQAVLDQIQFLDFEAGWVNGHVLQSSPKDAFFLLTTDGGKTWHKQQVTSEARTGAVEQFWFDSRTHGLMSLDRVRAAENGLRYELWESHTGGASWSVRQMDSKPVPFSRPRRDPVLQIKTDAGGKNHRLERREGLRWVPMATFSVSAGECRPAAPEPDPDPPPAAEPVPSPPPPASAPKKPPTLRKP